MKKKRRTFKNRRKSSRRSTGFKYPYRDPRTLTEEELERIDKADDIYFVAMRNFYNSIVPENMKARDDTELLRLTRSYSGSEIFEINSLGDDIMFSFIGTEGAIEPFYVLEAVIEKAASSSDPKNHPAGLIETILGIIRLRGFVPYDKKVLCVVQETPTKEFLDKDEIVVDINSEEYCDLAGEWKDYFVDLLNQTFGTTDVVIKVINKVNNPEAFKNYLALKQIMKEIDKFGVIGL